ncbi:MAG TPA: TlpA disulfide reductase family protein [Candidatus Limnocylindrales bacterium]|nr:TlpA disulfide reductase family protein [Candidatus Limnocylindrales bacterium]
MPLRTGTPLPGLGGVAAWINGGEPKAEELAGKPLLVHFWSITCSICHDVAGEVARWQAEYGPRGLAVIAVHQPRGPEELDVAKVAADAAEAMEISWPCAIDNEHALVARFENQFVPAYYLFDADHRLVHRQAGDRGFERLHDKIGGLLGERVAT